MYSQLEKSRANAIAVESKQNDITEDSLASDDVIFIHNAIADVRNQNDITEDNSQRTHVKLQILVMVVLQFFRVLLH